MCLFELGYVCTSMCTEGRGMMVGGVYCMLPSFVLVSTSLKCIYSNKFALICAINSPFTHMSVSVSHFVTYCYSTPVGGVRL